MTKYKTDHSTSSNMIIRVTLCVEGSLIVCLCICNTLNIHTSKRFVYSVREACKILKIVDGMGVLVAGETRQNRTAHTKQLARPLAAMPQLSPFVSVFDFDIRMYTYIIHTHGDYNETVNGGPQERGICGGLAHARTAVMRGLPRALPVECSVCLSFYPSGSFSVAMRGPTTTTTMRTTTTDDGAEPTDVTSWQSRYPKGQFNIDKVLEALDWRNGTNALWSV